MSTTKREEKLLSDKTGGFLQCSICGECVFVEPDQLKKYRSLIQEGIPTAQIKVTIKKP